MRSTVVLATLALAVACLAPAAPVAAQQAAAIRPATVGSAMPDFKYTSQNTPDRPPLPYLVRMIGLLTTPR